MTTGAAEMMLRCVFEGSISMYDMDIERRPYHRNCSCALHKSKVACSSTSCLQSSRNISFAKKKSWNECSMSLAASKLSRQPSFPSNSSAARNKDEETEALSGLGKESVDDNPPQA